MSEEQLHKTAVVKRGTGERIFLAFAGRRHRSDLSDYPAKSDWSAELVGILLILAFACMIGIVLWRHLSPTH